MENTQENTQEKTQKNTQKNSLSIILPAKNEAEGLQQLLPNLVESHPNAELIVVNDGSIDQTSAIAKQFADVVVEHPYCIGNGAAVKSGARAASGEILVFMDADRQHSPDDIQRLLDEFEKGYEMVVGARATNTHANFSRRLANAGFNKIASLLTGIKIKDLTSGFRAVNADKFKQFLYLLPNGFSYPTTITMAFLRSGYPLTYIPINAGKRLGKSKISAIKDGLKFLLIMFKIATLFSPLRLFIPISLSVFVLGLGLYAYTFMTAGSLTNMSAILFISALLIFLIGVVAEQISSLHYVTANRYAPNHPTNTHAKNKPPKSPPTSPDTSN